MTAAEKSEGKLRNTFLHAVCKENIPVAIFLINGIKLHGQIVAFDEEVVILQNANKQMIFRHAISTIAPTQPVEHENNNQSHY